jgi:hypothetical protein
MLGHVKLQSPGGIGHGIAEERRNLHLRGLVTRIDEEQRRRSRACVDDHRRRGDEDPLRGERRRGGEEKTGEYCSSHGYAIVRVMTAE